MTTTTSTKPQQTYTGASLLSDVTVHNKYSRYLPDKKRRETYDEIITRVFKMHRKKFDFKLKRHPEFKYMMDKAEKFVREKKVFPAMRTLQFAGKAIERNNMRAFNCAYTPIDYPGAFSEILYGLMLGTGLGFSVQYEHISELPKIKRSQETYTHIIEDSAEGWKDAVENLILSYYNLAPYPTFKFHKIRPEGAPLKTSGGTAPGPKPLKRALEIVNEIMATKTEGSQLRPIEAYDIVCHLADCVLSGGTRRSALIAIFSYYDDEMLYSKTGLFYKHNPQRFRSNNSAALYRFWDEDLQKEAFDTVAKAVKEGGYGEPGFLWLNSYNYGFNPCVEALLNANQNCNLTTIVAPNCKTQQEFMEAAIVAGFLGTLQSTYTYFPKFKNKWKENNEKERLLGVSITGICSSNVLNYDLENIAKDIKRENEKYANWLNIAPSARITLVKPEGTTSCVAGVTYGVSSGIHAAHAKYYIRRATIYKNSGLYQVLKNQVPSLLEDNVFKPETEAYLTCPIESPDNAVLRSSESVITQLERVKDVYKRWVVPGHRSGEQTHNVSATISVKEYEWGPLFKWMWENRDYYSGLSLLPYDDSKYPQLIFEEIDKERYEELLSKVNKLDFTQVVDDEDLINHTQNNVACAGDQCEI